MNTLFLDHNATTPVDKLVLEAMLPYFTQHYGNAASRTHSFGWLAEQAVEIARQQCASIINAEPQEIFFTSGSTEGINTCIKGVYENYLNKGNHIVTVCTEHKAVLDTCKYLESKGAKITYLPVYENGLINLSDLDNAITEQTILVSVMMANNETGVIQDIRKISEVVHQKQSILFSDTTQAIGKIPVDVESLGIDLLCMSAHKIYGPKGAGAIFVRRKNPRVKLAPLIHGGGHEKNIRSGTLNVPGIVGLGKACDLAKNDLVRYQHHTKLLRDKLENLLLNKVPVSINGYKTTRLPNTSNIFIQGFDTTMFLKNHSNIAISLGSACNSASGEPSHVLMGMGLGASHANNSLRISLGKNTSETDIEHFVSILTA